MSTRAIAHNTIIQIVGKIISVALGLLALGMMTRYLGQEQFGWYITTISFLTFAGILTDFGLIPVSAQMLSEPEHDKTKLFRNLIGFRLTTAIIFLGLAPLTALFFPYPTIVKQAIALTAVAFMGVAMNQVFFGLYQTKLKMHIPTIGELTGRIVLVVGLWLLINLKVGFMPIMTVVVLNSISYTLVLWFAAKKYTPVSPAFDWNIWKAICKKMWPIAIAIIFNVVYLKGDAIILSIFKSQSEVGIYGAAYRVIDILAQTAMMIMGVILPLLAYNWTRNLKTEFKKYYQQAFDAIMLMAVPIMFGLIMLADKIMIFVAGNEFAAAGKPLQILAIAVFGVYLGAIFGHVAVAINRQKQTLWVYISDAILTLIGYLYFIPRFGMSGAAWMTVFSELYAGFLLWITIKHYSQEKIQLKTFGKILLAGLLMSTVLWQIRQAGLFIQLIAASTVYLTAIFALKTVSKQTIKDIFAIKTKTT
ncbi:MAG: flippase [Candidatus Magasanikbacteria bacterium]|nr:flippase [Candidatus Magasanikbacteria bacterium]